MFTSLEGHALISVDGQEFPVAVSFDLARGRCVVSEEESDSGAGSLGLRLAFENRIVLRSVEVRSSQEILFAQEVGPFHVLTTFVWRFPCS